MITGLRAVFLGAPGAGKGTQAQKLAKAHHVLHISTGDMLREQVSASTDIGRRAKVFMDAGQLVPDDVITEMLVDRIRQPEAKDAWILDGFPRTLPQAQSLDRCLKAEGTALSHVVYFDVPLRVLEQRLTGRRTCSRCGAIWNTSFRPPRRPGECDVCGGELTQRSDDRPEAVVKRLEVYQSQTQPLLDYYRSRSILVEVDANRPPDEVCQELVEVVLRKAG